MRAGLLVAALVIGGVLLGMNYPIAEALWRGGPYALSAGGVGVGGGGGANVTYAWRINTRTGKVSVCGLLVPQMMLVAPDEAAQESLYTLKCSPWGPSAER